MNVRSDRNEKRPSGSLREGVGISFNISAYCKLLHSYIQVHRQREMVSDGYNLIKPFAKTETCFLNEM